MNIQSRFLDLEPDYIREHLDAMTPAVMAEVKAFFETQTSHRPSPEMYDALSDIPATVVQIIQGKAEPKQYLSGMDFGTGKSTTILSTIRLLHRHDTPIRKLDVGVLLAVGDYQAIMRVIEDMGLRSEEYAVLATKDATVETPGGQKIRLGQLGLGEDRINEAQVLLVCHAMIQSRLSSVDFAQAKEWFYHDKPREVRIWDETLHLRDGVAIPRHKLQVMAGVARPLAEYLVPFDRAVDQAKHGDLLEVPHLADKYTRQTIYDHIPESMRPWLGDVPAQLHALSGQMVRVNRSGSHSAVVTYENKVHPSLLPMLVTDASARLLPHYQQQAEQDKSVVFLKSHAKDYSNITIYYETGPSGKRSLPKRLPTMMAKIARKIKENPARKALVLHHKADQQAGLADVEKYIQPFLRKANGLSLAINDKDNPYDVKCLHWGMHKASNSFSDRDMIFTASILHYPPAKIEGEYRAASQLDIDKVVPEGALKHVKNGLLDADLQQGLGRGALRELEGNKAKACDIYIQAANHTGLKERLADIFPGCKVVDGWWPKEMQQRRKAEAAKKAAQEANRERRKQQKKERNKQKLTKRQRPILDLILARLDAGEDASFPSLYHELGMGRANFRRSVHGVHFQAALQKHGIEIVLQQNRQRFVHSGLHAGQ